MSGAVAETLALLDWKRTVFQLYADVRTSSPEAGWQRWRETRDRLFGTHPQSPLPAAARERFDGLRYFPYDPSLRLLAAVEEAPREHVAIAALEGAVSFERIARARVALGGQDCTLDLYWLDAYGGGLFLPFADATSGHETYGAGRYLLDTVKGADLGMDGDRLVLDLNFAYNPSCAYDPAWVCPLAPAENRLSPAVRGGELAPSPSVSPYATEVPRWH